MSVIFVTGATGYIGSRLALFLASQGHTVRAFVRNPDWLKRYQSQYPLIQICVGDVIKPETILPHLGGVDAAIYLVHSIGNSGNFMEEELACATGFAQAMSQKRVPKIVYLGGLADEKDPHLSKHLKSRIEVGNTLRRFHPLVIEVRASIILGSGSISFELIRTLVDRLPLMIVPRWVTQPTQPIFVDDIVEYLGLVIMSDKLKASTILEVGGPEQVSYKGLMLEYARQKGLHRWMISIPLLTPRLSSLWLGLVTPVFARIGRKLIEGLRNPSIVRSKSPINFAFHPVSYQVAIEHILKGQETHNGAWWFQAKSADGVIVAQPSGRFVLMMGASLNIDASAQKIDCVIRQIGGIRGYFSGNWMWKLRGWIDLLIGGVGHTRTQGRSNLALLSVGDVVDWWRVVEVIPEKKLKMKADMKMPGIATLQFEIHTVLSGFSEVNLTASYVTDSPWGKLYWWCLYPIHYVLFRKMLRGLKKQVMSIPK